MAQYTFTPGGVNPTVYMNTKLIIRKYEKSSGCIPLQKLKRDVVKLGEGSTSPNSMVHNFFNTIIHKYTTGICETYYDNEKPIVSCAYKIDRKAFNKKENLTIQVYPDGERCKAYYACALALHHNVINNNVVTLAQTLQ